MATFSGSISIQGSAAASITAATVLTVSNSGTIYNVNQTGGYAITLPVPSAGTRFRFFVGTAAAANVTISYPVAGVDQTVLFGIVQNAAAMAQASSAKTITLVSGKAAVGDFVELTGVDSTHYFLKAGCSTSGGITAA